MTEIAYGKSQINIEFDERRFSILGNQASENVLSDREIGGSFDNPLGSLTLEEIVQEDETVLLVVPDATRETASGQIVNLLVRRLIAAGVMPYNIRIIFATGIHREVSAEEKLHLLTPFIAQRIKTLNHQPRDLLNLLNFGETSGKIPIELNRALSEHHHVVLIGGVTFHYFAGFTGSRKLICPGLASSRTIAETHKLAFDFEKKTRREGVGLGKLRGNAVHEAFLEVVEKIKPTFSISTIVNDKGEAIKVFCGDWKSSHEKACQFYAEKYTIEIAEKRETVIVSCGGSPYDINLIQAHKALETASQACLEGGTIIWLAECSEGLGRKDFLKWFENENSTALAEKLSENYQVNGQTAWSLLKKAERFQIKIMTDLSERETSLMRLQKISQITEKDLEKSGYIVPFGAKFNIKTQKRDRSLTNNE